MVDSGQKKDDMGKKIVSFSVRFSPELFERMEKTINSIPRTIRPTKDGFIKEAIEEKLSGGSTVSENPAARLQDSFETADIDHALEIFLEAARQFAATVKGATHGRAGGTAQRARETKAVRKRIGEIKGDIEGVDDAAGGRGKKSDTGAA